MSTLVISDLHLGSLLGRDVLRRPVALDALCARLDGIGRLVLLGDTLELFEGRPRAVATAARPVLTRLAGALGRGGEIIVVAGNHDGVLVRDRVRAMRAAGTPLRPATRLPRTATPELDELCGWLAPARVEVRYPGVWLDDGVWATHGHYLDRHLLDALAGRDPSVGERRTADDYERARGLDATFISDAAEGSLPEPLALLTDGVIAASRALLAAGAPLAASLPGIAPGLRRLSVAAPILLDHGLHRRAALPAMAAVVRRLHVPARWTIFGHIHRRGPLPGDRGALWHPLGPTGTGLANAGSWVYDALLMGADEARGDRPYRPGGAVLVEPGAPPRAIDVLADVPDHVLHGR